MTLKQHLVVAVGVARVPFLLLAPAMLMPVFVLAHAAGGDWNWSLTGLILLTGVAAHIAVNALNEYEDFTSGLDQTTRRTPFSGGSGTLPANPDGHRVALYVGLGSLLLSALTGLLLATRTGAGLLLPGAFGIVMIIGYTRWINRMPVLCLLSPGFGFGLIMVNGAGLVLMGTLTPGVLTLSLLATFLTSGLLLLNQFPDVEADRAVGRRHVLIRYGLRKSAGLFTAMIVCAYLLLVIATPAGFLPVTAWAGLLTAPLAASVIAQLQRSMAAPDFIVDDGFVGAMGKNVAVTLLTPIACGLGMLLPVP